MVFAVELAVTRSVLPSPLKSPVTTASGPAPVAYNVDFTFFIGLIGQVLHHWPPTSPGLAGNPLHYEWFVFFHMAAASQVTHVGVPIIALRLDYMPTMIVLACQLLAIGRRLGRSDWAGVMAIGAAVDHPTYLGIVEALQHHLDMFRGVVLVDDGVVLE